MKYANIKTALPGPKSKAIMDKMERFVAEAKVKKSLVPSIIKEAKGAVIRDLDDNTFIDLAGGVGSLNVGHSNPLVIDQITRTAKKYTHTDFTVIPYEPYIDLAEQLCSKAPGTFHKKACFLNSGAEAVESAIKIARKYTNKKAVICFEGAFHGRTYMALSLTSKVRPYKAEMGPFSSEVYRIPYPYVYRWPSFPSEEEVCEIAMKQLKNVFEYRVSAEETAAVIIEPIQGEAGFIVPPKQYLNQVQQLCKDLGILFIVDEVQTGIGRTGKFFASEHFGLEPDLITIGKSIAAGMPLSGVLGKAEIMDAAGDGAIGGTFVGNPVACSAGLAVLDTYDQLDLGDKAIKIGEKIRATFESLSKTSSLVGEIRGVGAMVAIELVNDHATREPASEQTTKIIHECVQRGVILFKAGIYGNVLRFLCPLIITEDQLDEALAIITEVIVSVETVQS
ncbi:4-aminobutyrate--2-oxoglutarate transaminase [Chengkuizengella axinellae]|uniref:(S)-3-amino-2-methylpropionate transaminase n=1 Tax=Chengkuizengella axinellae TaxID=3064388 RepID=A0ABT9IXX0_9BACL|nr:4-aminobutyrate--2-oxoglutarate transaminase [Chengkuizengella sp. 2205SS18-9]MDP5274206.1 4-aminobutyrate--2-oxoglutarate transaminase [Chengkuizengella sp. 2205SS18-9]